MANVVFSAHPIKAIIFDCGGTLVDSEQFHFLARQAALQKHHLRPSKYQISSTFPA
jgi:beta-phosphoglucomutase-like phosphatase (HAD superfamily)